LRKKKYNPESRHHEKRLFKEGTAGDGLRGGIAAKYERSFGAGEARYKDLKKKKSKTPEKTTAGEVKT